MSGMTLDEFFAEARRLKCRMVSDDPAEVRAALDAKDAEIERLRASLGHPEWQPIETAPKDGSDIMLSNGATVAEGHWLHQAGYIRELRDTDGRYIDQDESEGFDGWIDWSGGMLPEPTHWQPLPEPPEASQSLATTDSMITGTGAEPPPGPTFVRDDDGALYLIGSPRNAP